MNFPCLPPMGMHYCLTYLLFRNRLYTVKNLKPDIFGRKNCKYSNFGSRRRSLRLIMYTNFNFIFLCCKVDIEMAIQYGAFLALVLTASCYFCGGDSARRKTPVLLTVYTSSDAVVNIQGWLWLTMVDLRLWCC
jgi:hypothetical protein